ncbi:helix-turn-helix transcriptional regulator [Tardiphaga robiniae]|uniref:Helix-turn-helix domain-containing protein n=1 Tax=Tardiphaga robiniae TaxID=943830 RepID=A0A7G6U2A9_9BRAD|nr:helix-turn-helix domain-containing protein [Tardiphaga robiniae]QND73141.1 helix-turn-helix domain-containing protein [Tardiphaga robiniae]
MKKLIDTKTLCEMLAVSKMTVWRLSHANDDFPRPLKIGRSTRFDLDLVNKWIAAQRKAV